MKIWYLCDRRACEDCSPTNECQHTSDITHAKNFELYGDSYTEKIDRPLAIFKTDAIINSKTQHKIREELTKQVKTGVVFCDGMINPMVIDGDLYTVTISKKEEKHGYTLRLDRTRLSG